MLKWLKIEQVFYSLFSGSVHIQDLDEELRRLQAFLGRYGLSARSAVDVGCGDGHVTLRLRDVLSLDVVHGFEINPRLVERARERGLQVMLADVMSLPVRGHYDVALSYGALHHFPDPARLIRSLHDLSHRYVLVIDSTVRRNRVHRWTGSRLFPFEASPYPIRTVDEIVVAMEAAGCRVLGTETHLNANIWHDRSFILGERHHAVNGLARCRGCTPGVEVDLLGDVHELRKAATG